MTLSLFKRCIFNCIFYLNVIASMCRFSRSTNNAVLCYVSLFARVFVLSRVLVLIRYLPIVESEETFVFKDGPNDGETRFVFSCFATLT